MVKLICVALFLFLSGCCSTMNNSEKESVNFKEHQITLDEKQSVIEGIEWFKKVGAEKILEEDGLFIVYKRSCSACELSDYLIFIADDSNSVEVCPSDKISEVPCTKIETSGQNLNWLRSMDFSSIPVVVAENQFKSNAMLGFPKILVARKRDGNFEQVALFYKPDACLKRICLKGDATTVPEKYKDISRLFDFMSELL